MADGGARTAVAFDLAGEELVADLSGALWWPAERCLAFADLHFEKGSSFAVRGKLVPPYDTRATLRRMLGALLRYRPRRVICLGDSFHDMDAAGRMGAADARQLAAVVKTVEWIWIAGNHDPDPPAALGGEIVAEVAHGPFLFRHEAAPAVAPPGAPEPPPAMADLFDLPAASGGTAPSDTGPADTRAEISGHFHPKATVRAQGRRITRPCFIADGTRLILPAFGAFTGGLGVLDPAIQSLFPGPFTAHLLGRTRLHSFPSTTATFLR